MKRNSARASRFQLHDRFATTLASPLIRSGSPGKEGRGTGGVGGGVAGGVMAPGKLRAAGRPVMSIRPHGDLRPPSGRGSMEGPAPDGTRCPLVLTF